MSEQTPSVVDVPETFRQCFMDSNDAVVITDVKGRIVTANPAWLGLYGYSIDEVRGQTTQLIKSEHNNREMYDYMWEQISDPGKGFWKGEIVNRKKSGEEVPLLLTITPIRREGEIIGYMGIGIDLTDRKELDEMRRLYETVVRHDLKAPLGSILTMTQTILQGYLGDLSDKQRNMLERVVRAGNQLQEIIATSLDMEKLDRGVLRMNPEEVDLFEIARTSFENLAGAAQRSEVELGLFCDHSKVKDEDKLVRELDRIHLQRCTDNLIKNAVEASPRGGNVDVSIDDREGTSHIYVHNGGDPIPPDVRPTLFHPFSTYGKHGGTGLGVYGVKLLVEAMGGSVTYATGEGGTTFVLTFPPS